MPQSGPIIYIKLNNAMPLCMCFSGNYHAECLANRSTYTVWIFVKYKHHDTVIRRRRHDDNSGAYNKRRPPR